MTDVSYAVFQTPIGACGIAWSERGLVCLELPERDEAHTRARVVARCPGAAETTPPDRVQRWMREIVALLEGDARDLQDIDVDQSDVPELHRRVYEAARTIPPGQTRTYGDIAAELGDPSLARAVGQALGQNPFAIVVPCHRVLAAHGAIGGFSAHGGPSTKARMLAIEGVQVGEQLALF